MNQSFYIGAVGAHQQQQSLNVTGNNISNVNTHGFKAERSRFADLMYTDVRKEEGTCKTGTGAAMWTTRTDFRHGTAMMTGGSQDYMIEGSGFFAVIDLDTSKITFTRNGAFSKAELQRPTGMRDQNGRPVVEKQYYLSDGAGHFVLGTDGNLIAMDEDTEALPVGIFDFINYDGMRHEAETKFLPIEKNGDIIIGSGRLVQGALEGSNVDLADEITKVIESQRAYSMALKMVTTSDEIESTINGLRG